MWKSVVVVGLALVGVSRGESVHIQAHRGASAEFLENTLPAFQRAMDLGVDSIELDVHVTRDGQVVVHHDFELNPSHTKGPGGRAPEKPVAIRSLTLADLRTYDVVDPKRLLVPNALTVEQRRMPTLGEVIALARAHPGKFLLDIEIKSDPRFPDLSPPPKEFASLVLKELEGQWPPERTLIRSFDHRVVAEVKNQKPGTRVAALTDVGFKDFAKLARELKPDVIAPEKNSITQADVEAMHREGVKVVPYTANGPTDWKRLIEMGVDGITTDNPAGLQSYVAAQGIRCRPDLFRGLAK